jgi:hypothetical protein
MKCTCCLLFCSLFLACTINKVDKHYRKQGLWKIYYDDEKEKLLSRGRYKDHKQVGVFKYYRASGAIYLRERYLKNEMIRTVYYYPNGMKQLEGMAQYISSPDTSYYRWEGDWKKYDSTGVLKEIAFYKAGRLSWYKPLKKQKAL